MQQDGILFFDSSLIRTDIPRTDITAVGIPSTDIAGSLGDTKSANMVMLGGMIAKTGFVKKELAFQAIESLMEGKKKNLIDDNQKAILEGMEYCENTFDDLILCDELKDENEWFSALMQIIMIGAGPQVPPVPGA